MKSKVKNTPMSKLILRKILLKEFAQIPREKKCAEFSSPIHKLAKRKPSLNKEFFNPKQAR